MSSVPSECDVSIIPGGFESSVPSAVSSRKESDPSCGITANFRLLCGMVCTPKLLDPSQAFFGPELGIAQP